MTIEELQLRLIYLSLFTILYSQDTSDVDLDLDKAISILLEQKVPKRELAKTLSLVTNISVNDLYERVKDL